MNRIWIAASILLIASASWASNPTTPEVWDSDYEDQPAAGDNVSQGDDWLRELKKNIAERMEVEHQIRTGVGPAAAQGDNGAHRLGSARCFVSTTAPTVLSDSSELHDNTAPGSGTGTLTAVETNGDGGANDVAVGHGRCWFNPDTQELFVFNDSDAGTSATADGWAKVGGGEGSRNYITNGSFERDGLIGIGLATCTDTNASPARDDDPTASNADQTTGATDGICDVAVSFDGNANYLTFVGPEVTGWTILGTPDSYSLDATDAAQGFGLEFTVGSDSAGDGIEQTLDDLTPSTEYFVMASVVAGAGATCALDVGGESTTTLPDTSSGTSRQTLQGFFTTDATPTDVTIELDETAGATSCSWDNVIAFPIKDDNQPHQVDWLYHMVDGTTASAANALTTDALTWSGGSCVWRLDWRWNNDGGANDATLEFDEDNDGAFSSIYTIADIGGNQLTISGSALITEAILDTAAAAGDTGDAVAPGDDLRFRFVDDSGADFDCNSVANCEIIVQQICSDI